MRAILFTISLKRLQFLLAPATKANALALADWKKRAAFQLKILLSYAGPKYRAKCTAVKG